MTSDDSSLSTKAWQLAADPEVRQAQLEGFRGAVAEEDFETAARLLWEWVRCAEQALERGWNFRAELIADLLIDAGAAVVPLLQGYILSLPPGTVRNGLAYIVSTTRTPRAQAVLEALRSPSGEERRSVRAPFSGEPESWERAAQLAACAWEEGWFSGQVEMERFLEQAYMDLLNQPADVPPLKVLDGFVELAEEVFFCEISARASDSPGRRKRDPGRWRLRLRQAMPAVETSQARARLNPGWVHRQRLRFMTMLWDYLQRPLLAEDFLALCWSLSLDLTKEQLDALYETGVMRDDEPLESLVLFRPQQLLGLARVWAIIRREESEGTDWMVTVRERREELKACYEEGMQLYDGLGQGSSPFHWLELSSNGVDEMAARAAVALLYAHGIRPPRRSGRTRRVSYRSAPYLVLRDLCVEDYRARGEAVRRGWLLRQVAAANEQGDEHAVPFLRLSRAFFCKEAAATDADRAKLVRRVLERLGVERTIARAAKDVQGVIEMYEGHPRMGWRFLPAEAFRQDRRVMCELILPELPGFPSRTAGEGSQCPNGPGWEWGHLFAGWRPPTDDPVGPPDLPWSVLPGSNLGTWLAVARQMVEQCERAGADEADPARRERLARLSTKVLVQALGAGRVWPHYDGIDAFLSSRSAYYMRLDAMARHALVRRLWPIFLTLFQFRRIGEWRERETSEVIAKLSSVFHGAPVAGREDGLVGCRWPLYLHVHPDDDSEDRMDLSRIDGPYASDQPQGEVSWGLWRGFGQRLRGALLDTAGRLVGERSHGAIYDPRQRLWFVFGRAWAKPPFPWLKKLYTTGDD